METIPARAVPVGAHLQYVHTPYGRQGTDGCGPVVEVYRPSLAPGLLRILFGNGVTVQTTGGMAVAVRYVSDDYAEELDYARTWFERHGIAPSSA